ncbi:MAG: hypothetical protein WBV94_03780 [Blastocatellia bacterium]
MNFIKRSPLAILVIFVMFGIFAGLCFADILHQREIDRLHREGLLPWKYYPMEEDYYVRQIIYGFLGGMISFATGIIGYVIVTRSDSESLSALNLGSPSSRK